MNTSVFGLPAPRVNSPLWRKIAAQAQARAPKPLSAAEREQNQIIRARQIISQVAAKHNLAVPCVTGRSKMPHHCRARQEAYYEIAIATDFNYQKIGKFFDGRDHTVVLSGILKHTAFAGKTFPRRRTSRLGLKKVQIPRWENMTKEQKYEAVSLGTGRGLSIRAIGKRHGTSYSAIVGFAHRNDITLRSHKEACAANGRRAD